MTTYFTSVLVAKHTLIRASQFNDLQQRLEDAFGLLPDLGAFTAGNLQSADATGSTANAVVLTPLAGALTAYSAEQFFGFTAKATNTNAMSVNISGLGAVSLKRWDGSDMVANDVRTGQFCLIGYTGTEFRLASVNSSDAVAAAASATSASGYAGAAATSAANAAASAAAAAASAVSAAASAGSFTAKLDKAANLSDLNNVATARNNLGLGSMATQSTAGFLQSGNNLNDVASAATARTNLGLGTAAVQNTGAFDAAGAAAAAQTNAINASCQRASNLSDLSSAATARGNLGLGSAATKNITVSAAGPSGGADGDVWLKY